MSKSTPQSLQGMIAVGTGDGVDVLGYLTWFSVPEDGVPVRRLKGLLAAHGLPPVLAPTQGKPINTFKRAMREQEKRTWRAKEITETTVAVVQESFEDCTYQVTRLVRDLDEKVINHPKAMRVVFNKQTEQIKFNVLGGVPRPELVPIMDEIHAFYDSQATKITGSRVRKLVRNYIRDTPDEQRNIDGLSGENLRGKSGGIYFVPGRHVDKLEALSGMLNELYGGRAYLHAVPMADSATEREIIRAHHIANTREEMKSAIADCKAMLSADRQREPRKDAISNRWAQYRAMERRSAEYREALGEEMEEVEDMARTLHGQLDKLAD